MERKIVTLKYGESVFGEKFIFRDGNPDNVLPISFVIYLIQDGERNILVDVGCNDKAGFIMSIFSKPVDVLKEYGVMPEDVTDIVITHHHHDHIHAITDYPNAIVHIQEDEYACGKKYFSENMQVEVFQDEKILADGIKVKKIGGHSVGSSIVLCNCDGKEYVFCGDECYLKECLEKKIPTGSSYVPKISESFVKEYGDKDYIHLLFHDPSILKGTLGYKINNLD